MSLVLRNIKGTPLTYTELDGNFTYLSGSFIGADVTSSMSVATSSYSLNGFPYTGSAGISGSLNIVGPTTINTNPLILSNNGLLGEKITFEKTAYSSSQIDIITVGITEIARGNNQGIYNAATEVAYVQYTSPDGTEWNSIYTDSSNYGWGNLQSIASRTYDTWYNAVNQNAGNYIIELPMVMHDLNTDKYYLFKFHKWTPSNVGGGFAYDRYEVINLPVSTSFTKPNYSSSIQDTISAGVVIARGNNKGLYNSVVEASYDDTASQSPLYTRWNSIYTDSTNYGWNNLGNVRNRKFDTWYNAVNQSAGSYIVGLEMVMHDVTTDQYYKIKVNSWTQNAAGGGFAYDRTLIVPESAILFPDGTSQNTAPIAPVIATNGTTLYSTSPAAGGTAFSNNKSIFLGNNAGYDATGAANSNFLGDGAGYQATNAHDSNFLGTTAGYYATNANNSNFSGVNAGNHADNAYYSNFLGAQAGYNATNAYQSNFLGTNAGGYGTAARDSNFLGNFAGYLSTNAYYSNFLGNQSGYQATNANNSNFIGYQAGLGATDASYSNFLGWNTGFQATNAHDSNFLGASAGYNANNAYYSNFLGLQAGYYATNAYYSNFLGVQAGQNAVSASNSNFIGYSAGYVAIKASFSNFLGQNAGMIASYASQSNFLGWNAGYSAVSASNSNFLGPSAGNRADNANNSNFIGNQTGLYASSASYSTLIGYNVGKYTSSNSGSLGIKSNNIIIGTNITLPNGVKDSINLGGIIFATGSYATVSGNPFSGSVTGGKVGIGIPTPQYTLDVNGSARLDASIVILSQVSASLNFASDFDAAAGGVQLGGLYRNGNVISIRIS